MKKDDPQINLRVPPELKARIQEAAKQNQRTQTAEILARLQASFDSESRQGDWIGNLSMSDVEAIVTRLKDELSK